MAEDKKPWRSVSGFVQFEVKDGNVAGKDVRWATVRAHGAAGTLVRLTLWPSHADVKLEQGDLVSAEGQYEEREVDGDNGTVTYRNLSVSRIVVEKPNRGQRTEVSNASSSNSDDGDEPW
jgi:hypothetical protein